MGNGNSEKAFTLIELLAVVVLMGLIITMAIPALRNLTYNAEEREYKYHRQLVHEAAKLYTKNFRGELDSEDASCFNIPYQALLQEDLIEEENIRCNGNIILEKRKMNGYDYNYYLTCKDVSGKMLHEADTTVPISCKGMSGKFKISYSLYKDGDSGRVPYIEGEWAKYIYGEYNASSPYNYPVDYFEYSMDFINWHKIDGHTETYTNYNGNIFVRAVDTGGNISEAIRHLVRGDSVGPTFTVKSSENGIKEGNRIGITVQEIEDTGVGVNLSGNAYSIDGINFSPVNGWDLSFNSKATVYVQDQLGNVTPQEVQVIRACNSSSGNVTAKDIIAGKTAWMNGEMITGTMTNHGGLNKVLTPGESFTVPEGYHNGTGKVTVGGLSSSTSATATANQILSGKTAWINGEKITGTMTDATEGDKTLNSGDTYTIKAGYHNGKEVIRVKSIAEQTTGNATADNLPAGMVAWVNGVRIVGTGSDQNTWYQKGTSDGNSRCTARLTNMETYFRLINNGIQYQYFNFTIDTSKYTKLRIGDITTKVVDQYTITLNCTGSRATTMTVDANQTVDISSYDSITVSIELQKNARLTDEYLGGQDNPPSINISYMNFE